MKRVEMRGDEKVQEDHVSALTELCVFGVGV